MFALLRQRNFALLWIGQLISMIGDWVLIVALPFFIYQRTGSALATGAMFIVETLPRLFLGSVAGVFVDRWDRRRTMVAADLLRAAILLPLLVVMRAETIWIAYVVAFAESTISQFFAPAYGALIPLLMKEQRLTAANSLNSVGEELTRLIGPMFGGLLLGLLGLNSVVFFDSFSYVFSGMMILLIVLAPAERVMKAEVVPVALSFAGVWREWREGLRLMRKERVIMALFIVVGTAMIGEGTGRAVFVPFLSRVAGGSALLFGWILTAQGIGGVLGALVLNRVSQRVPLTNLIALGGIVGGSIVLVEVTFPVVPVVFVCVALAGAPVVFFFVSVYTLLQKRVVDQFRGRVFGAYYTNNTVLLLVGMGMASMMGGSVGIRPMMYLMGGFYVLAGLVALASLRGGSDKLMNFDDFGNRSGQ